MKALVCLGNRETPADAEALVNSIGKDNVVLLLRTSLGVWPESIQGTPVRSAHLVTQDINAKAEGYCLATFTEPIVHSILSDPRSLYTVERIWGRAGSNSVFNFSIRIEVLVRKAVGLLLHFRPDRIVIGSTPHDVYWFICRTAELMGIPVLITAETALNRRRWIVCGVDEQMPLCSANRSRMVGAETDGSEREVEQFLVKLRARYDRAVPEYMRPVRRARNPVNLGAHYWLGRNKVSPRRWLAIAKNYRERRQLLRQIETLSSEFSLPTNYVVFFLHFQHERTSLPEGRGFSQQWYAIRYLADALPPGWKLVVREHPNMFWFPLDTAVRSPWYFEYIATMENVLVAPITYDPYELVDAARAVATLTGTVGVEALARSRPVVVFGTAQYRQAPGVWPVSNFEDCRKALAALEAGTVSVDSEKLHSYWQLVHRSSYPADRSGAAGLEVLKAAATLDDLVPVFGGQ